MKIIKLLGLSNGEPSRFDGKYVKRYDPRYFLPNGHYDGGILEVTDDASDALQFSDLTTALEYWKQSYGLRQDGKPNRPLTAFTVAIFDPIETGSPRIDDLAPNAEQAS